MAKKYYAVRVGKVPEYIRHGTNVRRMCMVFQLPNIRAFHLWKRRRLIWEGKLYRRLMERP